LGTGNLQTLGCLLAEYTLSLTVQIGKERELGILNTTGQPTAPEVKKQKNYVSKNERITICPSASEAWHIRLIPT